MKNLESTVKKTSKIRKLGGTIYDITVPVFGDINLYHTKRKQNLSRVDAIMELAPLYTIKYLTLGSIVWKLAEPHLNKW